MKRQRYSMEFPSMNSITLLLLPFLFHHFSLLILLTSDVASSTHGTPRPRRLQETISNSSSASEQLETHFYQQTLDHFNYKPESYATFRQRYVINSKYWGGASKNAPIFVYLGGIQEIDIDMALVGVLGENAHRFKALQVYIEHRFYGQSIPFGTLRETMNNASTRGYFNSAQAIADYAELIIHLKTKLFAYHSPIIVFGLGYGGMLAAWFRLKYPHVVLGALASSAPILYFDDITPQDEYYSIVAKNFEEYSKSCHKTIQESWSIIDGVASQPNGLSIISKKFRTCWLLNNTSELERYLILMYAEAAQLNDPLFYPLHAVCDAINGANDGTDILDRIFAGLVAFIGNQTCYIYDSISSEADIAWSWQMCTEMVMPTTHGINDTMFPPDPFNLDKYITECKSRYGIVPRPNWVTTYYGGHDIKLVLQRFGSNIIFSNGLKDPFSSAGILKDLSDTLLAVITMNGTHGLDILKAYKTDPEWLIVQRKMEIKIIKGWLKKYYVDLQDYI